MTDQSAVLTQAEIESVVGTLAAGRMVRRRLPSVEGRVHIDRLQPFVCVYREPIDRVDTGTGRLLLGQASYILSDAAEEAQPMLRALVSSITDLMVDTYGAALVLELWSAPGGSAPPPGQPPPPASYRIVAAREGVPHVTLETLEHALLATDERRGVEIEIDYCSGAAPPGALPLLTAEEESRASVFLLGLEVPPLYRDPQSGELIPNELRRLTRALGHAMRQAFYAFAHARARFRPAHYHELGRRAMTKAVGEVDRGLAEVSDSFDVLLSSTPVNTEDAYARFVAARCDVIPEFLYRPQTVDPAALKHALYKLPVEDIEDPALHHLFTAQRDELDREITMLADRDTSRFLLESQQLYGGPDERLLATAKSILETAKPPEERKPVRPGVSAREFAWKAEQELAYYRQAWPALPAQVELREDVPGLMVSKGHLLIGHTMMLSDERIEAVLHHEIGTHILTYYNGLRQPLSQFHAGMPSYEATQEGLAVLSEHLCGGLNQERLRLLAARVVAVDSLIRGADFLETFRVLSGEHDFGCRVAYTTAMRVHRGGGLTKDVVYLRGLIAILDHLAEGHRFEDLLLGKVALKFMEIVEELRWRRVVSPGPLQPRYLDNSAVRERLANLPRGSDVARLAK